MPNKIFLYSHDADIDGMGGLILSKLAFDKVDYRLVSNMLSLENVFRCDYESGFLYNYDMIFITDLALPNPSLDLVAKDNRLNKKIKIFDHHKSSIDANLNKYDFTTIIVSDEKGPRCGTDLFYQYLVENNYLKKTSIIDDYVELTRLLDTWEWKKYKEYGQKSVDMGILFNTIGIEKYVDLVIKRLKENTNNFYLNDAENEIVKSKKEYMEEMTRQLFDTILYSYDEDGNKFGILYAKHDCVSSLCEYARLHCDKDVKYLITVDLDKGEFGQKSYRNIDENFDVSSIALKHGGGGHKGAAGVNITENQKDAIKDMEKEKSLIFLSKSKWTH